MVVEVSRGTSPVVLGLPHTGTDVPPAVAVRRVTGAGDTFMAAHIVAERAGAGRQAALARAVQAAALYVSGDASL